MSELNINQGGLFRCCVETIAKHTGVEEEGTVLPCKWCSSAVIVKDNCWQWYPEYSKKYKDNE